VSAILYAQYYTHSCPATPLIFFSAFYMAPSPGNDLPPLGKEAHDLGAQAIQKHAPGVSIQPCERFDFYDRARTAYAIVQASGERRPYGNYILVKGVVGPDGNDLKP
jgi:L-fucose mutarotase